MSQHIDTLLLLALPASGKSEVRKFLRSLPTDEQARDFGLGESVQLDDYPYVHMMRRVSQEARALKAPPVFFRSDEESMIEARDWGTLVELVNEDYDDLVAARKIEVPSAASWLLARFEAARAKVGAPKLGLSGDTRVHLLEHLEKEARDLLEEKNANVPATLTGKTVVIEFARGGPDKATPPLPAPLGYQHSLACLSPEILAKAGALYVWVTPEESRRKNTERADPNDPGSILNHGVPMSVMLGDYGCDDMDYLIETSGKPDHVKVQAHGKTYLVPVGRFDNRKDKTTFVRGDKAAWKAEDVAALRAGLAEGFAKLRKAFASR